MDDRKSCVRKAANRTAPAILLRRTLAALAPLLALWAVGCVYRLGAQHHIEGVKLPYTLPEIASGSPANQLIALLGEPSFRQPLGEDREQLVWRELLRPRGCRTYLFGVIPLSREPRLTRELIVTTHLGRIEKAVEHLVARSGKPIVNDLLNIEATKRQLHVVHEGGS